MVIFIHGATHSGKTATAQRILEKYNYPYLSQDHIKMGLIRSGVTRLTPQDDEKMTEFLWPVIREIAKTAIENRQNLVIEGCYFPPLWKQDFTDEYLKNIKYCAIILSEDYIRNNFDIIKAHACDIEKRLRDDDLSPENLICENEKILSRRQTRGNRYFVIDDKTEYNIDNIRDYIFN